MFAIAISYTEYEEKVEDVDFVVNNSIYIYSDIDTGRSYNFSAK